MSNPISLLPSPRCFLLSAQKKFVTKFVTCITNFVTCVRNFVTSVTNFVIKNILYEKKKSMGEKKNLQAARGKHIRANLDDAS